MRLIKPSPLNMNNRSSAYRRRYAYTYRGPKNIKGCFFNFLITIIVFTFGIGLIVSPFIFIFNKGKDLLESKDKHISSSVDVESTYGSQNLDSEQSIVDNKKNDKTFESEFEKFENGTKDLALIGAKGAKSFFQGLKESINTPEERKEIEDEFLNEVIGEIQKQDKVTTKLAKYVCENYEFEDIDEVKQLISDLEEVIDAIYSNSIDLYAQGYREALNYDIGVFSMEEVWRVNPEYFLDKNFKANAFAYTITKDNYYRILAVEGNIEDNTIEIFDEELIKKDYRKLTAERLKKLEEIKS
ncbi:hypothetical protein [Wukongibacter baidiensis]